MQPCNLPDQGEAQPHTAIVPAAGLIHPKKRLKNALLKLRRYTLAAVPHTDEDVLFLRDDGNTNTSLLAVVFDGILTEIKKQAVDQGITANDTGIPLTFKVNPVFFRQWGEIRKYFFNHGLELDRIFTLYVLKMAHFQQNTRHLAHPLGLLPQETEEVPAFFRKIGVFRRKKLYLSLQQCQRRAQFMGGISRKLTLGGKSVIQALQHLVE